MAPAVARDEQPKPADPHAIASDDGVLPTDVLYEILLRLPANVLCRLRLVCRSWRSLTSDPRFTREHSSRHPLFAGLELQHDEIHILDLSGNIVKRICPDKDLYRLSTLGDLAVCVSKIRSEAPKALLLNPATGAVDVLPDGSVCPKASICLIGHIASTGEYKLLRIGYRRAIQQPCEVMTLGGGSDQRWRTKPDPLFGSLYQMTGAWRSSIDSLTSCCLELRVSNDSMERIGLFDLAKEEWRAETLQLPPIAELRYQYHPEKDQIQVAKFDGYFAIVHHNNRHCCSMNFWLLADMDKGIWNKQCSIQCAPHWKCHEFSPPYLLAVLDDGKVVLHLEMANVLTVYDPRTGTWADLATLEYDYYLTRMYEVSLL